MPTLILHTAVGVAAARATASARTARLMLVLAVLSALPDIDVLAFAFGIPYQAPFGHRGAFHSLTFALVVGALCALDARAWQCSRLRMFAATAGVIASHGLLDALTDGGLGIAWAWPLSNHRFFLPWRPIPVAPIGTGILSSYGRHVLVTELLLALPLFGYAMWPRRTKPGGVR